MTIACAAPDPALGVAIRLSTYVDCQARALGENGFQALVGGPMQAGLLSGLVTIFIALIGYRLILGATPSVRDGVGWAVRLGVVLALVTGWPAFQTLAYRVAADGPGELAAVLLPASGLPSDGLDDRVQAAYDTMRLGSTPPQPSQDQNAGTQTGTSQPGQGQAAASGPATQGRPLGSPALPQTASVFVVATEGVIAAFRIAIGFLLAVAPLAILGLLFDATLGLFSGWVRAVGGAALSLLAATIVTAIDVVAVESELAHLQTYAQGGIADVVDSQGLTTIVLLFAVVMPVVVIAAARMASAFKLPMPNSSRAQAGERAPRPASLPLAMATQTGQGAGRDVAGEPGQARVAAVADALAASLRREQALVGAGSGDASPQLPSRRISTVELASRTEPGGSVAPLGVTGRRAAPRRTLSAARRDRTA